MKRILALLSLALMVHCSILVAQTIVVTGRDKLSIASGYSAREAQEKSYSGRITLSRANVAYRSYLRFDLSGLPNKPVKDVKLFLYSDSQYHKKPAQVALHALKQGFDEKTASYKFASAGVPWRKDMIDSSQTLGTVEVGAEEINTWKVVSDDKLTEQVNEWLKHPGQNHGFLLTLTRKHKGMCFKFFSGKEQKKDELLPKLIISYDGPIDVIPYGVITPEIITVRKLAQHYEDFLEKLPTPHPISLVESLKRLKTDMPMTWVEEELLKAKLTNAWFEHAQKKYPGKQLALWSMSPWQQIDRCQLPGTPATGWQETILKDEIHELALGITNLGPRKTICTVKLQGLPSDAVELRSSYWVQAIKESKKIRPDQDKFLWVDDPIPLLYQNKYFSLESGAHTRLFVTLRGKKIPAGNHAFTITVTTTEGEAQTLRGTLKVDSHALAWPKDLHVSSYAYLSRPCTTKFQQLALQDVLDHFENTFVTNGKMPNFDKKTNSWNYSNITSCLKFIKPANPKMVLFFWCGPNTRITPGKDWGSPEWKERLATVIKGWVKACEDEGFSKKQFAMYPVDEVYGHPIGAKVTAYDKLLDIVKVIKGVDPEIQVFVNPVCFSKKDTVRFKELQPYVDIWAPVEGLYDNRDNTGWPIAYKVAEKIANQNFFKAEQAAGKPLWIYRCGGPSKRININSYYRQFSWRPWLNGITGLGIWSYNDVRDSSWSDADRGDFTMVYELRDAPEEVTCRTDEKLIPAVRYSAWRRSLQDYVLLDMAAKIAGRDTVAKLVTHALTTPKDTAGSEQVRKQLIDIIIGKK